MAGYDPQKRNQELQRKGLVPNPTYAKPVGGMTPKGAQLPVQNPEAIGTQPFVPAATLNKLQTMNQLPNVASVPPLGAPQGLPTPGTTGAINNAFAGNVQPPPLKTAQAAVNMAPVSDAPQTVGLASPPPLAGYAKMGGQEYKIDGTGQATKYVNGQAVGDPAQASFTQAEVEKGRAADAERNAKTLAANEAYRRDTHVQSEMMRAAEQNNPQTAAAIRAAAVQGSQQQVDLAKQAGANAATTQAAAAKGAAQVQSAQMKEQGATARNTASNKAAMDRTKENQKGAKERAKLAADAAANKPQKPLVMLGPDGAEQAYIPNLQSGTLQPLQVQQAPMRQLPNGMDEKQAFAEAKAFIAKNPWAADQVRARLQEYGFNPAGLDNG